MKTFEKNNEATPAAGRAENYPLSKPMVDHDQKGIKTIRKGKVSD